MDVGFLDEVAAFLDLGSLLLVATPRNTQEENELAPLGASGALADESSSSEDAEPYGQVSGGDDSKKTAGDKKRNTKEERGNDDRRKRYRVKVKNEREELKRMERELSVTIQELVDAREGRRTSARTDLALSKNFWQDLANTQLELRLRSEAEQKRLVAAIQSQGVYIQNLRSVLPGEAAVVPSTITDNHSQIGNYKWLRLKSTDSAFVQAYLNEVDENYARVDKVFQENCMESVPLGAISSIRQHNPSGEVEYTQYVHKLLQPFSFEDTCKSTWATTELPHRQHDRQTYGNISDPDNTLAFKFRLKMTLTTGSSVSILKRAVARRYVRDERVVIVWKIFSEGEGIFSGMDSDETAWVSIRPYSDADGLSSGALMEICSRQVPVRYLTTNADDLAVKAFQAMMQDAIKEDERETIRSLEKLLLDDTLAGINI